MFWFGEGNILSEWLLQVELSFHAGDVITVFGEMDEDGFYMGELNGVRGLVPSNFLQTSPPSSLMPSQMPPMQQVQQPSQPIPPITVAVPEQPRAKGVAFQESAKKVGKIPLGACHAAFCGLLENTFTCAAYFHTTASRIYLSFLYYH